jgi:putative transposase
MVSALHAHLVFVTTYRPGVLTAEHITHLRDVFTKVCGDFGATLVEYNGEDDHVHLLAEYPPKVSITALVNSLKGVSARRVRQRYKIRTHREHLWPPSYSPPPCGGAPLEIIKQYIEQQHTLAANPGPNAGTCAARFPVMAYTSNSRSRYPVSS